MNHPTAVAMTSVPNQTARRLFAPIAVSYERWAAILSLGQDLRWRRTMVKGLALPAAGLVLDVAAGTGSITRVLQSLGQTVVDVDISNEMLRRHPGPHVCLSVPFRQPGYRRIFQ